MAVSFNYYTNILENIDIYKNIRINLYICLMSTYKEQKENKMNFVLLKDCNVLGTFGSLKKVCDFVTDDSFPSYWTLVRKKDNPIIFDNYKIFKAKHH